MKTYKSTLLLFFGIFVLQFTFAQELPFQEEVNKRAKEIDDAGWEKGSVVFTGSSSVRMWKNLQEQFPEVPIINSAFGGSKADQLLLHLDKTVLRFEPSKVFIYEGDNDINAGESPEEILEEAAMLRQMIAQQLPGVPVVFISPKPSVARWQLKEQYEALNAGLQKLAAETEDTEYADVWAAMLDENGEVYTDIFIEDNLHMNEKGYAIWREVLAPYISDRSE